MEYPKDQKVLLDQIDAIKKAVEDIFAEYVIDGTINRYVNETENKIKILDSLADVFGEEYTQAVKILRNTYKFSINNGGSLV